jgi:hypothetical protein
LRVFQDLHGNMIEQIKYCVLAFSTVVAAADFKNTFNYEKPLWWFNLDLKKLNWLLNYTKRVE